MGSCELIGFSRIASLKYNTISEIAQWMVQNIAKFSRSCVPEIKSKVLFHNRGFSTTFYEFYFTMKLQEFRDPASYKL